MCNLKKIYAFSCVLLFYSINVHSSTFPLCTNSCPNSGEQMCIGVTNFSPGKLLGPSVASTVLIYGKYALCVGASCTINDDNTTATCTCTKEFGVAEYFPPIGTGVPGDFYSYFSYANDQDMKIKPCTVPANQTYQWADCGGAVCNTNNNVTTCTCEVKKTTSGQTYCTANTKCGSMNGKIIYNGAPCENGICQSTPTTTLPGACNLDGAPPSK